MRLHANAKMTPMARALLVNRVEDEGWTVAEAAEAAGVSTRTAFKWRARWRTEGWRGLRDRDSAPRRRPRRTPGRREAAIRRLREQRWPQHAIARRLQMARSTVGAVTRRQGLGRLPPLQAPAPVVRYQRARAGELLHIDIKAWGRIGQIGHRIHGDQRRRSRGIGWDQVHVCVDDATRLAYVEVLPTATAADAVAFVRRAVQWFAGHGVPTERIMTDNGAAYRAHPFAALCAELQVRHLRTRPYTPRPNGKAERFIQTLLREWAYLRPYTSSARRRGALPRFLRHYNRARPHSSLNFTAPLHRLQELAA
jgi:transposase InsO family protein